MLVMASRESDETVAAALLQFLTGWRLTKLLSSKDSKPLWNVEVMATSQASFPQTR